ncbi:peptidase [Amycolatopsis sp. MJM2582]|uniref:Conserved putative secreted protein n=1 Tax=Amycolatopsis japonica TaxID=208439 RepID=A0A075UMN7_9PSEU|nr:MULTISPECIES: heme-binding protein [Amycolatopsis]AIG75437.1 Conserved putative secreted protein [Amycolatopsis japonica]KFZ78083.1 peptidase [Amycolatopsis sp. MJM2582]OKJ91432.1 peptidase [Amycolatopsis sp. CB00013]RSN44145.1 heme-binding protein [Amycolatopsis sp. WAC 04197]
MNAKLPRTRLVLGMTAGLATVALATGVGAAQAQQDRKPQPPAAAQAVVQTSVLGVDAATRAAQAALDAAEKEGQRVTVAVIDRSGDVRVLLKGDGAGPQTEESAKRKAFTAVSFGQPTSALAKNAQGDGPTIRDIPGTLFLGGGVPVAANGGPIAGIGVGGAPSGDLDEKFAAAGLRAIGELR